VTRIIRDGGPWEDPVLQAILKAKPVSQELGTQFTTYFPALRKNG